MTLATTAASSEMPSGQDAGGEDVLAEHGVATGREREGAGVDRRRDAVAEAAEDVAAHADGGRHEHEQAGVLGRACR